MITSIEFFADLPIPQLGFPTSRSFHAADGWTFQVAPGGIRVIHVEKGRSYVIHGVGAVICEDGPPAPAAPADPTPPTAPAKKGTKKS